MGAIHNNLSNSISGGLSSALLGIRLAGVTAATGIALLLLPAASGADPTPQPTPRPLAQAEAAPLAAVAQNDANAVSMSPGELSQRPNTTTLTAMEGDQAARPLTRAAAQLRVESMSPSDWLTRFGDVTVGQIETTDLE